MPIHRCGNWVRVKLTCSDLVCSNRVEPSKSSQNKCCFSHFFAFAVGYFLCLGLTFSPPLWLFPMYILRFCFFPRFLWPTWSWPKADMIQGGSEAPSLCPHHNYRVVFCDCALKLPHGRAVFCYLLPPIPGKALGKEQMLNKCYLKRRLPMTVSFCRKTKLRDDPSTSNSDWDPSDMSATMSSHDITHILLPSPEASQTFGNIIPILRGKSKLRRAICTTSVWEHHTSRSAEPLCKPKTIQFQSSCSSPLLSLADTV